MLIPYENQIFKRKLNLKLFGDKFFVGGFLVDFQKKIIEKKKIVSFFSLAAATTKNHLSVYGGIFN